jgi:hypothetical protein
MFSSTRSGPGTRLGLRCGHREVRLGAGEILIGRDPDCALCFDDPLISRRHARIAVVDGAATIVDLSSANGVFVNGQRVHAAVRLTAGDRLLIGKQEIDVVLAQGASGAPGVAPVHDFTRETVKMTAPQAGVPGSDGDRDATTRVDTFALIAKVVDRILAEGRGADAEQILAPHLDMLLREATRRGGLPPEAVARATEYAIKLAEARRSPKWLEYVVQLHVGLLRPFPEGTTSAFLAAAKVSGDLDRTALRAYVSRLLTTAERLTTTERQDLEVLGSFASASTR